VARWLSAGTIVAVSLAWAVVAEMDLVPPLFLPPPWSVLVRLFEVAGAGFADATLLQHLTSSLGRVFAALLLAALVGIPAGLAIGWSEVGRSLLDPVIEFLRPIPPLAYLPLVIIWCGIGEASKVLVIGIAMLAPIAISTASGVRGVPPDRLDAARSLGASPTQLLGLVVLPNALPEILAGIRIALGAGWSTLVAAELIAATRGLGFMIQSAAQFLVTDVVIMGILVIAVVAFGLEAAVRFAERLLVPWRGRT